MSTLIDIPSTAKVWVYQSVRPFNEQEISIITSEMNEFLSSWQSHGSDLKGYFEVVQGQFIFLAVDESIHSATGCSIDSSVATIKKIEQLLGLNLTDKGVICYEHNGIIKSSHFTQVKSLIEKEEITPDTTFFDASVTNFEAFQTRWKVAAKDSWLNRYF